MTTKSQVQNLVILSVAKNLTVPYCLLAIVSLLQRRRCHEVTDEESVIKYGYIGKIYTSSTNTLVPLPLRGRLDVN